MANPQDILDSSGKKNKYLEQIILAFEKDVQSALKELYVAVLEMGLQVDANKLVYNQKSLTKVQIIDQLVNEVNGTFKNTVFVKLADRITKAAEYSRKMYQAAGFSFEAVAEVEAVINLVSTKIGITKVGKIIRGGYLDTVANADILKRELKDIIINGISSQTSIRDLNARMKEIIIGSKTKDSKMMRYFGTFIHDAIYKTSRAYDKAIGEALGVKKYMYANDLIETSRGFCIARAFKIFDISEIESWKDLAYPYFPEPYDPFIDCGGYNCRHWLVPVEKDDEEIKGINEAADKWREETQKELQS